MIKQHLEEIYLNRNFWDIYTVQRFKKFVKYIIEADKIDKDSLMIVKEIFKKISTIQVETKKLYSSKNYCNYYLTEKEALAFKSQFNLVL